MRHCPFFWGRVLIFIGIDFILLWDIIKTVQATTPLGILKPFLPDHAYTKFKVYKGSQFKGLNDRDIRGNPLGGTPEVIDPDKNYVVVEWAYDEGF